MNHDILVNDGQPVGGESNYDGENRKSFGKGCGQDHGTAVFSPK